MKAITLWQPWASLIADGLKQIETRPRAWGYEGVIAIHAGLLVDPVACQRFGYAAETIPRGAVLAIAYKSPSLQFPHALCPPDIYGDFRPGRYGYPLMNISKLAAPLAAKGKQGFWEWVAPRYVEAAADAILAAQAYVHAQLTRAEVEEALAISRANAR